MDQLIELGIFAAKLICLLVFFAVLTAILVGAAMKAQQKADVEFEDINEKFEGLSEALRQLVTDKKLFKEHKKKKKKARKSKKQKEKKNLFVLDFSGDIHAKQVDLLRDEITTLLGVADEGDEVLVKIESPGGTVHGYGLAAAQLKRIKDAKLKLTAAVDKVAASGGYLMACTADQILAAPFAILGSIGVLAQVPNFHRLLKKNDIDYEEITSGEYKRTISLLGEITEKGKAKFTDQIADTHDLFKNFVQSERPVVNISEVGTGEYWYGQRALDLKLVDLLQTSDDFLFSKRDTHRIVSIKMQTKKSLGEKISEAVQMTLDRSLDRLLSRQNYS